MILSSFPQPPSGPIAQYMANVLSVLRAALQNAVSVQEAAPRIILQAPGGVNYSVTVNDAGALVVAVNSGKVRP